ncbi:MAG: hypothetical protein ACLPZM_01135 [Thermoplasmata archaeon]
MELGLMKTDGVRVGFFGSFYPYLDRLSSTSIGLVHFLSLSNAVSKILVFSPEGSSLPPGLDGSKIAILPVWRFDRPLSIFKTLWSIVDRKSELDLLIFNVYLTSFGRRPLANGVGLLLPVAASFLMHTRPVVYMHNFVETQDIQSLGYNPTSLSASVARTIERMLAARCELIAPLASQSRKLEGPLGRRLKYGVIPYAEAVPSATFPEQGAVGKASSSTARLRILLFGSWGPQKDVQGIVKALEQIDVGGPPLEIVIAGGINPNFPSYSSVLDSIVATSTTLHVRLRLGIPESEVRGLFCESDVVILPYNATGGYSAVMNVAAYYRTPVLAYDLGALRECAAAIGVDCKFFSPGDGPELRRLLADLSGRRQGDFRFVANETPSFANSVRCVEDLFGISPGEAGGTGPARSETSRAD